MNCIDIFNTCYRELIYSSQLPVIFSESIDWDILRWSVEDWSKAFQARLLSFRCGERKCQKSPVWESQCKTELHTFDELIAFSKDENFIRNKWWYFDYKSISCHFGEGQEMFKTVSWHNLGFPGKGAKDSTIWIGSPGAHTACHFDSYSCNIVAQVFGRKRWILFPPSETKNLKPTRIPYEESSVYSSINFSCSHQLKKNLKVAECFVVDMNPGDVLLIPPKWWHYVENLSLAISVNMWIPLKDDDFSRLDEALIRYFISCLIGNNLSYEVKNFLLNPNELDLKAGTINLEIIEFCKKKVQESVKEKSNDVKTDQYPVTSHSHKYKIIQPISLSDFYSILPKCSNFQHVSPEEILFEDSVSTLTSVINSFCHPDIICQIRNKFLNNS